MGGVLFLFYPVLGHLADVYLTRYRALISGMVILINSILYIAVYFIANAIAYAAFDSNVLETSKKEVTAVIIPGYILFILGQGLFEANAIQFGLDQLLEAPTPKLIAFIHWYYWAQSVGQTILYESTAILFAVLSAFEQHKRRVPGRTIGIGFLAPIIIISLVTLVLHCVSKEAFLHSESRSKSIQECLQSPQVLLEAQGP